MMLYEHIRKMHQKGISSESISDLIDLPLQDVVEITETDPNDL